MSVMLAPPSQQPEQCSTINEGPYRQLRNQKCSQCLLGCEGRVGESASHEALAINGSATWPWSGPHDVRRPSTWRRSTVFADKVAKVRASTNNAPSPTFTDVPAGSVLREFCPLSVDDVISLVRQLPDKSSAADPIPTYILKQVINLIAPFVAELFNRSLVTGHFPHRFKDAFITTIVKKAELDPTDASSLFLNLDDAVA